MNHTLSICLGSLALAGTCAAQTNWTELKPKAAPVARQNHGMAYDSARKRTVLFGAWDGNQRRADTWEFDGANWQLMQPSLSPSARDAHAMAYDSARGVVVLTGGYVSPAETWEYNGKTWTLHTPKTPHTLRTHPTMAYDSARKLTVLYGSLNGAGQTWEWNGIDWAQRTPTTTPNGNGAMAYDSLRRVTVLFEGSRTWEWNGVNWTRNNATPAPPSRFAHSMAYDSGRQRIVMFGGGGQAQGDTWEFDGAAWTRVQTAKAPSSPRRYFAMAYDSDRRCTMLFGGRDLSAGPKLVGDTWQYKGSPCHLIPDTATISIANGGTQKLSVEAGASNANRLFFIFGSASGTSPGITIGVKIPLNPDAYTNLLIGAANTPIFTNFTGILDANGNAAASLNLPANLPVPSGAKLHHAYVVYRTAFTCASNPVLVTLK